MYLHVRSPHAMAKFILMKRVWYTTLDVFAFGEAVVITLWYRTRQFNKSYS